ncbi:unnamed protein product [Closterium sp. Naga37s-1]|nr:unnamed protein product [Closterium sp. Naga37s-1]
MKTGRDPTSILHHCHLGSAASLASLCCAPLSPFLPTLCALPSPLFTPPHPPFCFNLLPHSISCPLYLLPTLPPAHSTSCPLYLLPTLPPAHSISCPLYLLPTLPPAHSTSCPLYLLPTLPPAHSISCPTLSPAHSISCPLYLLPTLPPAHSTSCPLYLLPTLSPAHSISCPLYLLPTLPPAHSISCPTLSPAHSISCPLYLLPTLSPAYSTSCPLYLLPTLPPAMSVPTAQGRGAGMKQACDVMDGRVVWGASRHASKWWVEWNPLLCSSAPSPALTFPLLTSSGPPMVKRMRGGPPWESLEAHALALARVGHPNVLRLVGWCSWQAKGGSEGLQEAGQRGVREGGGEGGMQEGRARGEERGGQEGGEEGARQEGGEEGQVLVYEWMERGSLQAVLQAGGAADSSAPQALLLL